MHAVVVDVSMSDADLAVQELRDRVVPVVSSAPGFVSGVWLRLGEGRGHSVVVFESEETATAAAAQVRAIARPEISYDSVSVHEVVASA